MVNNKVVRLSASEQIPKIMEEMQTAAQILETVEWGVSVFGSARLEPGSPYYALCEALGARLAQAGLPVIAGGGPGLMEAANKGAFQAGGISIGLNIRLPKEKTHNPYQTHRLNFEYFNARKATFFMHSLAYIALPGGWGTMDEVFEVLTLVQTKKLAPAPIVLIGSEFWNGLIDWMRNCQAAQGLISSNDLDLIRVTDSLDEAMACIESFCSQRENQTICDPVLPE